MRTIKKTLYPLKLVHDLVEINGLPFHFSEDLILRRATEKEVENFRHVLINSPNLFPVGSIEKESTPLYEVIYEEEVFPENKKIYQQFPR